MTKELLQLLLKESHDCDFYVKWLENKRDTVFNNITAEDISIHKKIKRSFDEYRTTPLSVEIAKTLIKDENSLLISEIDYIITGRNKTTNKLTGVSSLNYKGIFDKEHYWDKLILANMSRLLKVTYPRIDWDKMTYYNIKQQSLF